MKINTVKRWDNEMNGRFQNKKQTSSEHVEKNVHPISLQRK